MLPRLVVSGMRSGVEDGLGYLVERGWVKGQEAPPPSAAGDSVLCVGVNVECQSWLPYLTRLL